MSFPIRHLPVVQNWDCHVTGTCCKEYLVTVSDEERKRIESQGWDKEKDLGGLTPFKRSGLIFRHYHLNHRADGSCVFLGEEGRCRIHEKHGYEAKPLPCRLFPFILVPQGDRWGVGVRFACPSAARNKGRSLTEHDKDLREFAELLVKREGLTPQPDGTLNRPPSLVAGRRISWPDLRLYLDAILSLLRDRKDPIERRLRRCLTFSAQCNQASRIHEMTGPQLADLLDIFKNFAAAETPKDPATIPKPTWIGRILFRQLLAVYTRKDHGPNRGIAAKGRFALLGAAWRFARGNGTIPRLHRWIPETTFERIEETKTALTPAAEEVLERYYYMKVGSLQFCGAPAFGMSFWEGFNSLMLTFPIMMWVTRAFADEGAEEGVLKALSIVDDHFGFNKVLGTIRQRLSQHIVSKRGETVRLIAHYAD